jgi:hypothetical protein
MADSNLWFPGARLNQLAPIDGGSILGGKGMVLWHDTESSGFPSYSTGFFPHMTINPLTGEVRQHIPANRACRALRNESGGVQTNRWRVFQIECCGFANKVPFHPVMAEVAQWAKEHLGVPLECTVDWLPYDASFGDTRVRLSGAEWDSYAGHLGHMHAPENAHGDPGWPFPIGQIIAGVEEDWFNMATKEELRAVVAEEIRAYFGRIVGAGQASYESTVEATLRVGQATFNEAKAANDRTTAIATRVEAIEGDTDALVERLIPEPPA